MRGEADLCYILCTSRKKGLFAELANRLAMSGQDNTAKWFQVSWTLPIRDCFLFAGKRVK